MYSYLFIIIIMIIIIYFPYCLQAPMVGTLDNTLVRLLIPECTPVNFRIFTWNLTNYYSVCSPVS